MKISIFLSRFVEIIDLLMNISNSKHNIGFLFDLDGVIIDSEKEYSKIWARINQEFPTGIPDLEQKIKGSTLSKILNDNYKSEETKAAVAKRLHELENQMRYEYLPHAQEFLKLLKSKNLPCALVTSSDNEKMEHLKDEVPDIFDYFDFIITGDLVKNSKPAPEGYLLAASKLNKDPKNCVVFEDSLQGVQAGKNAGTYVVGITGTIPQEQLMTFSHKVINNFNELDLESLIQILSER